MAAPTEIALLSAAARTYIFNATNIDLDGSETSLAFVDHYIDQTVRQGGQQVSEETLQLLAPALGAYFGQVAIDKFGGTWQGEGAIDASWQLTLEAVPLSFSPIAVAVTALAGQDVAGYEATLETTPRLGPLLEQALAATPPVDEHYFYSLTGRLELIAQAVDILVEWERKRRDESAKN